MFCRPRAIDVGFATSMLLSLMLSLASNARAQNICTNGSFENGTEGWGNPGRYAPKGVSFDWQKEGGRSGTGAIHVRAEDSVTDKGPWIWSQTIDKLPKDHALKISIWIKGKSVSDLAAICVQAWKEGDDHLSGFATTQTTRPLKGDFDWTHAETILVPNEGTSRIILMAFISGTGEAWFDDVTVEPTDKPAADASIHDTTRAGQPGLFMARGAEEFTGHRTERPAEPHFALPLPLCYREQAPLSYRVWTIPEGKLAKASIRADTTGGWILEGDLAPLESEQSVELRWESLILCAPRSFDNVPKSAAPPESWPEEARPWLASTWCVQSDDPRIQEIAKRVKGDGKDVMAMIGRACTEAGAAFRAEKGPCQTLTAVEALDHQGSCTSCANLVAALLRGAGVPARILSGYPSWSGPLQTHYIVEAYVPGYGWYPIESTMLRHPWPPYGQIAVRIIPPEDEGSTAKGRPFAAPGVPYLSLTEFPRFDRSFTALGTIDRKSYCDHEAVLIRPLEGKDSEWSGAVRRASERFSSWTARAAKEYAIPELKAPDSTGDAQSPGALLP